MKHIILAIVAFAAVALAMPRLPPSPVDIMEKREPAGENPCSCYSISKLLELTAFLRLLRPAAGLPDPDQGPNNPPGPDPDPGPTPNDLLNELLDGLPDPGPASRASLRRPPWYEPVRRYKIPSLLLTRLETQTLLKNNTSNLLRKSSLCDYFELSWKLKNEVQCCTCNWA
jgi:hypothetical protein